MNREDFPLLNEEIIYFDNSATSLKPKCVIDKMVDYYTNYPANAHRGDYDLSLEVDNKYEGTRTLVKDFINAKKNKEIIFTSGATDSLNKIIFHQHNLKCYVLKAVKYVLIFPSIFIFFPGSVH